MCSVSLVRVSEGDGWLSESELSCGPNPQQASSHTSNYDFQHWILPSNQASRVRIAHTPPLETVRTDSGVVLSVECESCRMSEGDGWLSESELSYGTNPQQASSHTSHFGVQPWILQSNLASRV